MPSRTRVGIDRFAAADEDRRAVLEDVAGDRAKRTLAEVVVGGVDAGADRYGADEVVAGDHAARGADVLEAVEEAGGLMLANAIRSRCDSSEAVEAETVGERAGDDDAVDVEQVDRHAGQRNVAGADDAVAFGIGVNAAADRAGKQLAEVVVDCGDVGGEHDLRDEILSRDAAGRTGTLAALIIAGWAGARGPRMCQGRGCRTCTGRRRR